MYSYDVILMHFLLFFLFTGPYYKHFAFLCKLAKNWPFSYKIGLIVYEIGIMGGIHETSELAATCPLYTNTYCSYFAKQR